MLIESLRGIWSLGNLIKRKLSSLKRKYSKALTVIPSDGPKALVSYIQSPFKKDAQLYHCNAIESICMAEVLKDLGYAVDVIEYTSIRNIDYSSYALIIGFGYPFANSLTAVSGKTKLICYLTGANPNFSNVAEAKRAREVYKRKNKRLAVRREVYWPWGNAAVNADALVITGNSWTESTYADINEHRYVVPVPYITSLTREYRKKNNLGFLWFAGGGALHKGLDLVIDAFVKFGHNATLDICGPIAKENDFISLYQKELFENPRIKFWGMVEPDGEVMGLLAKRNKFIIHPSCSEGGSSSVITCMAKGLVPIVTEESAVNVSDFGLIISEPTVAAVYNAMLLASEIDHDDYLQRSMLAVAYVAENHSMSAYSNALKSALQSVIGEDDVL